MASNIDICNLALTKLGAQPIPSLTSNDPKAAFLNRVYFLYRDDLQTIWRWNFTRAYAELPVLSTAPPFGYYYAYQLPSNFIRLENVDVSMGNSINIGTPGLYLGDYQSDRNASYQIVGQQIWTNVPAPLRIIYARRMEDPTQFDQAFVNALASYIAWNGCEQLTGSNSKKDQAERMYNTAVRMARMTNAIQCSPEQIPDDTFMMSRLSS